MGIPRDHPQSYHTFMWRHFFSHVNIPPTNVHIPNGNAPDLAAECDAYEAAIVAAGGIDLFLAGIGGDGHIAFNEPGSSLASRTRVKTLAYDTVLDNARFFDNDITQVPRLALTVGVQTVLDAREVVAIVVGARKAVALRECLESSVNHMWTLSALQLHRHAMIVADEDATLELRVRTVKVRAFPYTREPRWREENGSPFCADMTIFRSTSMTLRKSLRRRASIRSSPGGSAPAPTWPALQPGSPFGRHLSWSMRSSRQRRLRPSCTRCPSRLVSCALPRARLLVTSPRALCPPISSPTEWLRAFRNPN